MTSFGKNPSSASSSWLSAWIVRLTCCVLAAWSTVCAAQDTEAEEGEIIVQLREGGQIGPLLNRHGLSLTGRFGQREIYRLKVVGRAKVGDMIKALRRESDVRLVEPNIQYQVLDHVKSRSWAIGEPDSAPADQWATSAIRLAEAHRVSKGRGVRVAVLDTGVDRSHPALAGKLLPGFDFVDWDTDPSEVADPLSTAYGHGTHVAGLVAQVAPEARIMPLRVLDAKGRGNLWVLAEAMLHAVDPDSNPYTDDGAHIINLSLSSLGKTELFKKVATMVSCNDGKVKGTSGQSGQSGSSGSDSDDITLYEKIRCAGFGGAVVVVAAGNNGSDKIRAYPAAEDSPSLVSVAATNSEGWLARFSNRGWVKMAAPGTEIQSAIPGGGIGSWSGTSMAAPLVSGTLALLRAKDQRSKPEELIERMEQTGRKICGTPMRQLDAAAALNNRKSDNKVSCPKQD